MNSDHDLDCLIDEAARQMAQREPSAALSEAVMERVSANTTLFPRARLVWGSMAAAMVISAAVMFVGVKRTAPPAEVPPQAREAKSTAHGSGLTAQGSGTEAQGSRTEAPVTTVAAAASRPVSIVVEETEPTIDSMAFDVIAPAPLEVDRLEVTLVKAIDPIEVAPLEIEPLSASDD